MSCPDPVALTTYASLNDLVAEPSEELAELEAHLLACGECSARVDAWRHSLGRWAEIDLVDHEDWSNKYFDDLQGEVEGVLWDASTQPVDLRTVRKTRQQVFAAVASLAAVLLLGFLLQNRVTDPVHEHGNQLLLSEVQSTSEDSGLTLEAKGRALGRALLASLSEEGLSDSSGSAAPLWDARGLLTDSGADLDYFFNHNYHDAIDELSGRDADELIELL